MKKFCEERTHVHGGTREQRQIEGLTSRNGKCVDVHRRALDRSRDITQRRNRTSARRAGGSSVDGNHHKTSS